MKRSLVALLLIAAALSNAAAESGAFKVVVVKADSKAATLDAQESLAVQFWLQQLYISAVYHDVVLDSTADEWALVEKSPALVRCEFAATTRLALPGRRTLDFDEMLLPVPVSGMPSFAYLRRGSEFKRLAKYDPWVYQKLRFESGLSTVEPTLQRNLF